MEKGLTMPAVKLPEKKSSIEKGGNKMKKIFDLTADEVIEELKKHPTETPYNRHSLLVQLSTYVMFDDSPNYSVKAMQYLEDNKNYPDVALALKSINFRPPVRQL